MACGLASRIHAIVLVLLYGFAGVLIANRYLPGEGVATPKARAESRDWKFGEIGWISLDPELAEGEIHALVYKSEIREESEAWLGLDAEAWIARSIREGKARTIAHGTRVRILAPGDPEILIRVEEGEHSGWTGLIRREWLGRHRQEPRGTEYAIF